MCSTSDTNPKTIIGEPNVIMNNLLKHKRHNINFDVGGGSDICDNVSREGGEGGEEILRHTIILRRLRIKSLVFALLFVALCRRVVFSSTS